MESRNRTKNAFSVKYKGMNDAYIVKLPPLWEGGREV